MFSFVSSRERFARRHTLSIAGKNAIFTYIPKNGCSTLRYSIAIANGLPDNSETVNYMHAGMHSMIATSRDLANCTYAFIVLRCPYRRIASAFLDKAVSDQSRAGTLFPRQRNWFGRNGKSEASIAKANSKVRALTFADFLGLLQNCKSGLLDHHFRPQSNFLLKQGYNDYFALEKLNEAESLLLKKLDLQLIDKGSHGVSRRKKSDVDASSLTIEELLELRAAGYAPTYESLFTDASRRAVDAFYSADLALYKKHFGSNGLMFQS